MEMKIRYVLKNKTTGKIEIKIYFITHVLPLLGWRGKWKFIGDKKL